MLVCNSFQKLYAARILLLYLHDYLMNILRRSNRCTDLALVYVINKSCDTEVDYPYVNIVLEIPEHEQSHDMSRCIYHSSASPVQCTYMYLHAMYMLTLLIT